MSRTYKDITINAFVNKNGDYKKGYKEWRKLHINKGPTSGCRTKCVCGKNKGNNYRAMVLGKMSQKSCCYCCC